MTTEANLSKQHYCVGCYKMFKCSRAINSHWQKNIECLEACNLTQDHCRNQPIVRNEMEETDKASSIDFDTTVDIEDDNELTLCCDISADEQQGTQKDFSNLFNNNANGNSLPAKIELVKILNTAKAPLYLYDHIMVWAKTAVNKYDVDFGIEPILSREKLIQELKSKYMLDKIEPEIQTVTLCGSGNTTEIVRHNFKDSLFSLLQDKHLMQNKNLLISVDEINNAVTNGQLQQ